MVTKNLLLELGTEELPPKSLRTLAQSLHDSFVKLLGENSLSFSSSKWYATPRRLALFITDLADKQADKEIEVKGPAIKAAFDANGNPPMRGHARSGSSVSRYRSPGAPCRCPSR